ncbi:MAG: PQQ-binding-like beta-propeller repeat protein [Planctomycetes bacterium]|nr:PQQ-binding-like beta-propeller repeat protein [Planctomycetota bacterium]
MASAGWLAAAVLAAGPAAAQELRAEAPVGAQLQAPAAGSVEEGEPVEMFENPNLDRYLRRAQAFLDRDDHAAAIQVLQDVVEGRTVEVIGGEEQVPGPPPPAAPDERRPARPPSAPSPSALDARRAVFSADGRLYRPVRRLCHELLSRLPDVGIEIYRARHEAAAAELLERALAAGTTQALEEVVDRYFITLPAGRAMQLLADRLMHAGRYRAAVQVLRDLAEVYPAGNRRRLGVDDVWCGVKAALCLQFAGDPQAAREAMRALAAARPGATLRIQGELHALADLVDSPMFAARGADAGPPAASRSRPYGIDPATAQLIPVWQYRFADPDPYREPKASRGGSQLVIVDDGSRTATMPHAGRYGPGTWTAFVPSEGGPDGEPGVLFLEHFRLRLAGGETGLLLAEGDGAPVPPAPRENHPRVRVAASDFALLRPIADAQRCYAVLGFGRATAANLEALKASELVAYDRGTMQRAWTSAQWLDGDGGLRDVTFLAAPTVFGERLLLPAVQRGTYLLACLERGTGRPLWLSPIHAGGTPFFKAPGAPVVVQGGIAYVLTNAGCVAAVDAFSGEPRWIRRYERHDPLRPPARPQRSRQEEMFGREQFLQANLNGFLPNDLVVAAGLVVLAACDSDLLLGLDGATGQPVWMLDGATRYAPYGRLRELVGADADSLFVTADRALVCIDLRGGLLRWARELPAVAGRKSPGRGRGTIAGAHVLVPGEREILAFDTKGERPLVRIPLPVFDPSHDPLAGPFHLVAHGPWLAAGFQGGVELFSSSAALQAQAAQVDDVGRRARLLALAGDRAAAEAAIDAALQAPGLDDAARRTLGAQWLALVAARARPLARGGSADRALAVLDGVLDRMQPQELRLQWHLARLELCSEAADLRAREREQQRLYDFLEGRT